MTYISWKSRNWVCSNRFVVVAVVHENSSEVANNVDNKEDRSFFRLHGQVAALRIARYGMIFCCLNKQVVDRSR